MTQAPGWALLWEDKQLDGYTDYFVAGSLYEPAQRLSHLVTGPRGWRGLATCKVEIDGLRTVLDYRPFKASNDRAGMDNGLMVVSFGRGRNTVKVVHWQYPGKKSRVVHVLASVAAPPSPPAYHPRKGKLRRPSAVVVRGHQAKFRILVRAAYADSCVFTGCAISEALEAVHIDPYENRSQHNPRNGLLMRKDLHALFDRSLIAVNPRSLLLEVAPSLRLYREYGDLHKHARMRSPASGYEGYAPAESALKARWEEYQTSLRAV